MKKILSATLLLLNFFLIMGLLLGTMKGDSAFIMGRSVIHLIIFLILLILNMFFLGIDLAFLDSESKDKKDRSKFLLSNLIRFGFLSVAVLFVFSLYELSIAKTDLGIKIIMYITGIHNLIISFSLIGHKEIPHNNISET